MHRHKGKKTIKVQVGNSREKLLKYMVREKKNHPTRDKVRDILSAMERQHALVHRPFEVQ